MDNLKNIATGTIITLIIGGTAYTFTQEDVINNFANDTGLSQEQAAQYVEGISEEELLSFRELGQSLVTDGQTTLDHANSIDCLNLQYEWESPTLSCSKGKAQAEKIAKDHMALGHAYIKLESDSASKDDISAAIALIDQLTANYQLELVSFLLNPAEIDEEVKVHTYNKAVLKAALESN